MPRRHRSPPRLVEVLRSTVLSPNMLRITFTGAALEGFPTDAASANIKLLLPHVDQDRQAFAASLLGEGIKPVKRTYTVVEYRETDNELDLDFALHYDAGPATLFARDATAGQQVGIAGPSQPKLVDPAADWYLIAGDMTAIPAMVANFQYLPAVARGYAVIEVQHDDDQRAFDLPEGLQLQYLTNPSPEKGSMLADTVKSLPWLSGTPSVWIAGESGCVRELRTFLAKAKMLDREHRYTSGYWNIGQDEDAFQMVKRSEPDI